MAIQDAVAAFRRRRSLPEAVMAKSIRQQAGLTQQEIGEAIGVSGACISRWESGRRSPRGKSRDAYADLLAALTKELLW